MKGYISGELFEIAVRKLVAAMIKKLLDEGSAPKDALGLALKAIFTSDIMKEARKLPGFLFPVFATGVGAVIAKSGFIESVIQDDTFAAREIKIIFNHALPKLLLGTAEGIDDAGVVIDRALGAVRSDSFIPASEQIGQLDHVWSSTSKDSFGRIASLYRDEKTGVILKDSDGVPTISDPVLLQEKAAWDRDHGGEWKEKKVSFKKDGKDQTRMERYFEAAKPFPFFVVLPLDVAIARMPAAMKAASDDDIKMIKEKLEKKPPEKPKSWPQELSDDTWEVMQAIAATIAEMPAFARAVGADSFDELAGKIDTTYMNQLGKMFKPLIVKPLIDSKVDQKKKTFKEEDFETLVQFVKIWMGGKLTWWNRIQLAVLHYGVMIKNKIPKHIARWKLALVITPILLTALTIFGVTAGSAIAFLYGVGSAIFRDTLQGSWSNPVLVYTVIGGVLLILLTTVLLPIQFFLKWVNVLVPSLSPNWLIQAGRECARIVTFFMLAVILTIISVVPNPYRGGIIVIGALCSYFATTTYLRIGNSEKARAIYAKSASTIYLLGGILTGLLILGAVMAIAGLDPRQLLIALVGKFNMVVLQCLASVALFSFFFVWVGKKMVDHVELSVVELDGERRIGRRKSWFTRFAVFVLAVAMSTIPWITTIQEKYTKPEKSVLEKVLEKVIVPTNATEVTGADQKKEDSIHEPQSHEKRRVRQKIRSENPCSSDSGYSYGYRKAAGCFD